MTAQAQVDAVRIELLGGFRVVVAGREIGAEAWPGRRAVELVQLLSLADGRRLTRDEVIDALWPSLDVGAGAANLRKAAHYARQALGRPDAVVLRGGQVSLLPGAAVETDVDVFESRAQDALGRADPEACADLASTYPGDLLPEALYEGWTQGPRARLRSTFAELLRASGQWERLVEVEPTDEPAYRELMRGDLAAGSRPAAIRWYGRLRTVLRSELGILPSAETRAIYDECVAGLSRAEPELVGRELEAAQITAALRSESGARPGMVVVRGSAGIGKSAFCRELARLADSEGWTEVSVAATESGSPYAPIASVVDELVAENRSLLDSVGDPARSVLAELTSVAGPAEPLDASPTRHRVIGAFRRLLLAAGDGAPVLLVVDDAHLADEATIDLLIHLSTAGRAPLLVVLAYRPEPAPEALTRGVARLERAGSATAIDLGPLDRDEAAALVAAASSAPRAEEVVERIVELAQGNPFLALELAESAVAGVPALVPKARDAITARFLDFDDETAAILGRLALTGDDLDPATVVALTGASDAEAFAALEAALAAGVLVVDGARYRFRHDLVRQALAERLPPHQRQSIHREAAQRLAAAGAEAPLIAHHWLEGDEPREALEWLLAAARQAVSLGAYADAVAYIDPLLEEAPGHAEALRLRAEALDALGDRRALAAYDAAAEVVGESEAQDLRAMRALATIKLGDPPGGLEIAEEIEPTSLNGRVARALALSGAAALGFGDPQLGTEKAAEARRLALQAGDPDAIVIASWAQAAAAHARGELRDSLQADLKETHSLGALAVSVFDGQLCMTQRLLYGSQPYADVIGFADSLEEEAERLGAARGRAFAVTIRGEAKLLAGQLDEADVDLAAGAQLHREIFAATGESFALQRRSEVALYRGDRAESAALLDQALAVARDSDVGFHLLDRIYGARVTAAADPRSALAALEEAEDAVRGPMETCPTCRITLAVPAAIAAARAQDFERLAQWEPVAEYLATVVMRLPAWDAALAEVKGHSADAGGDARAAHDHFRAAAAGFGAAGQPLDQARCAARAAELAR